MGEFKSWEEMSTLEQMACTYWDLYKDAYGVRPRGIDTQSWSEEDFRQEFLRLEARVQESLDLERQQAAKAADLFEARVAQILQTGADCRATALRWIHEAEGTEGDDEYLCFTLGLPYGYFKQAAAA